MYERIDNRPFAICPVPYFLIVFWNVARQIISHNLTLVSEPERILQKLLSTRFSTLTLLLTISGPKIPTCDFGASFRGFKLLLIRSADLLSLRFCKNSILFGDMLAGTGKSEGRSGGRLEMLEVFEGATTLGMNSPR